MAIKLYQWDTSVAPTLVSPNKYDGTFEVKWHQSGYVSMTEGFAVLFNDLNEDILVKSDADGVAAVKAALKPKTDNDKVTAIRAEYSADDEFCALRTEYAESSPVQDRIAAIVKGIEDERDGWLDVS
jgi:hypothetical protein|tara:strand:+ start:851 stop:1231 length:381 start_codon:yes stop_codon:yes gene_type:complete